MEIKDLVYQTGEWLKSEGPLNDIIISTRIRLARNLSNFPFSLQASNKDKQKIESLLKDILINRLRFRKTLFYFSLDNLPKTDREFLLERHLISKEHAKDEQGYKGLAISYDETVSVMVNEEDHLRMQVLRSGFQVDECWQEIQQLDDEMEKLITYAFHPQFGYLTCCPTNVGTGLRVSVLAHLPALVITKQIEKVLNSLSRIGYAVRGLFGEGTKPIGDFFQISNQKTLGKSEEEITTEFKDTAIPQIAQYEQTWRQKLFQENKTVVEDRVWRAYGILKYARSISSEETLDLLSSIRLGVYLGIIKDMPIKILNQLLIFCQPCHLQKLAQKTMQPPQRDLMRASYLRQQLKLILD
jgi:protein arginine kinase